MDGASWSLRSNGSSIADDEDRKDSSQSGNKRQRVHFSCTECHRRKQKCNRETPCQHCIARKIPERCKTFQPGEDPADMGSRMARLERSVQDNFQRVFYLLQQQSRGAQPTTNNVPPSTTSLVQVDAAGSEAGDEVLEGGRSPNANQYAPAKSMTMKIDNLIDSFSGTQGASAIADRLHSLEGAMDLDSLMSEYGATESTSASLMAAFPSRELGDALVDHFFTDVNWLRQPLSQKMFRKTYELFWSSGPTLTPSNINVFAFIVLVMAISLCSIERPDMVPTDPRAVRLMARRLAFAGRRALLVSTTLSKEDRHQALGYVLASRFCILDRRITEAWTCIANAVKTAHSIGLHRDGTKLHLSPHEIVARRLVWAMIYFTERNLCMNLGRPTQIDDNFVDTQCPSETDDQDVFPDMFKPAPTAKTLPGGPSPSPLAYTMHRHRLAFIMGKIISTYQNLQTHAHYSDIVSIDKELEQYREKLPGYFRSEIDSKGTLYHVDTSWDEAFPFVPITRYLIESEIDHIRVSLHRPYLLRNASKAGHRYEFSRRSCIASAHRTILQRKDIIAALKTKFGEEKIPKAFHLHLATFKTLNSLIIIGMYLLVTPDAEDAEMLLGHLRFYADAYKKKQGQGEYGADEMKVREGGVVQLFLQRIEEARAERASKGRPFRGIGNKREEEDSGNADGRAGRNKRTKRAATNAAGGKTKEEDTAGVLLDLNQSAPRRPDGIPYNEYVDTWSSNGGASAARSTPTDSKGHKIDASSSSSGSGGEVMAPWPYLPLNTHQNHPPSRQSSLTNSGPSPLTNDGTNTEETSATSIASNLASTSAQQLFESWARYAAFDMMDVDTMNSALYPAYSERPPMAMSGYADGAFSSSPAGLEQLQTNTLPSSKSPSQQQQQQQQKGSFSNTGVQLSTLPAPLWNSSTNNQEQTAGLSGVVPFAVPDVTGTSAPMVGGMNTSSTSENANIPSGGQLGGASFDPNFWQSLIDKIAS